MAITDGTIEFKNANANTVEITMPEFPYVTIIDFPFDIVKLDDGSYDAFDATDTFDIRYCEADFVLSGTVMNTLNDWLKGAGVTKGRAKDNIIEMNVGSGFFPFGPDKGDVGPFTTAIEIIRSSEIQQHPMNYYRVSLRMTVDPTSYPVYSLPSEVGWGEGNFTIGTIANNRFPPSGFKPRERIGYSVNIEQDGNALYQDRGVNGDNYETAFSMVSNERKAAAVIDYLAGTARAEAFNITSAANFRPFGRDIADGVISVRLINSKIKIKHNRYNSFSYDLSLSRVA